MVQVPVIQVATLLPLQAAQAVPVPVPVRSKPAAQALMTQAPAAVSQLVTYSSSLAQVVHVVLLPLPLSE